MVTKLVMAPRKVVICDFCLLPADEYTMDSCAICGQDVCGRHKDAQQTEDGTLCPDCAKTYEIVEGSDDDNIVDGEPIAWGCVAIREKATGKSASHLWRR